ncbi:MAG: hypothetical protein OSA97_02650 [Nevskia sp.]|nr:hypothetical protein [Nevskia sp.]
MTRLSEAVLAGATIALLLYAAMTAARNMAGTLQEPMDAGVAATPARPVLASRQQHRDDFLQLARRDD